MPRLIAIAFLLTALPLAAQDTPAAPTPPQTSKGARQAIPTGRITGTVLCSDTHRPARGAMLIVTPIAPADESTLTGRQGMARVALDGTYSVEHLLPGEYAIIGILPGYISPMDQIIAAGLENPSPAAIRKELLHGDSVTILGGEAEHDDITLERGAAVSGHVVFSDGAPATQVSIDVEDVNAKRITGPNAEQAKMAAAMGRSMFTHQSQNTDDLGRFRISGLKPGIYRIAAVSSLSSADDAADGMGAVMALLGGSFDPAALRVYSGDTLHPKAAKTYELRSGDEVTGIDITIPLNAYHQVKGTLTSVDGRTINKATLTLTDTADDSVTYQTEVAQGTFAFTTVAAGTYTLAAKDAKIIARQPGSNPDIPMRYAPTQPTNAFADATTSVIVKGSDVPDVALTLTEVPLPPAPTLPANLDPDN